MPLFVSCIRLALGEGDPHPLADRVRVFVASARTLAGRRVFAPLIAQRAATAEL